jgi:hypothetical protein
MAATCRDPGRDADPLAASDRGDPQLTTRSGTDRARLVPEGTSLTSRPDTGLTVLSPVGTIQSG